MAKQLNVSPKAIKEYSFSGRTIERHRSQIRQFFGFRETTVEDAFELTKWLQSLYPENPPNTVASPKAAATATALH
jgi:hypothetical protein